MKVEEIGGGYMTIRAEEGHLLRQVNIPWQKAKMYIISKTALRYFEEVPLVPVTPEGQFLFGFMEV